MDITTIALCKKLIKEAEIKGVSVEELTETIASLYAKKEDLKNVPRVYVATAANEPTDIKPGDIILVASE